jgi:chitinase
MNPFSFRPQLEQLDGRCLPSASPALTVSDVTLLEGNSGSQNAWVTLSLSAPSTKTVKVNYQTVNGTARAGSDYDPVSGTATFAPGQTRYSVLVPVRGDTQIEPDETFSVKLQNPRNATIADGTGVVTILDDGDARPRPIIDIYGGGPVLEGTSNGSTIMTFTVSLSAPSAEAVTVNYATFEDPSQPSVGIQAGYVPASGTLTFAPGETTRYITVEVYADNVPEPNQTYFVGLSGASPNALVGQSSASGTILDDDGYGPGYWWPFSPADEQPPYIG